MNSSPVSASGTSGNGFDALRDERAALRATREELLKIIRERPESAAGAVRSKPAEAALRLRRCRTLIEIAQNASKPSARSGKRQRGHIAKIAAGLVELREIDAQLEAFAG